MVNWKTWHAYVVKLMEVNYSTINVTGACI